MSEQPVILLPLDDRPCNLRFPAQLGRIAGREVTVPPRELLGSLQEAGQCEALLDWLDGESRPGLDASILAIDMLCYGGLVASRKPHTSVDLAVERLRKVARWAGAANIPVHAFNIITRLSITVDCDAAARDYDLINRYAQTQDRGETTGNAQDLREAETLKRQIGEGVLESYLQARRRNHHINRQVIDCVRDGLFDDLVLCQEDAAEFGFHRQEQSFLREHVKELNLADRVSLYPGADEAACTLLARHVLSAERVSPRIRVLYSHEVGRHSIPPFEDRPLHESVSLHLRSVGAVETCDTDDSDIILFVNACAPMSREQASQKSTQEKRLALLAPFVRSVRTALDEGRLVAVADVAFPNGGDTQFVELLLSETPIARLASYGGWNTAGNTLGTVLAHGVLRWLCLQATPVEALSDRAHYQFLFERLIDDWAYQAIVRREMEDHWAKPLGASIFDLGESAGSAEQFVCERLATYVERVYEEQFRSVVGDHGCQWSAVLPWKRGFEIDFRVEFPSGKKKVGEAS